MMDEGNEVTVNKKGDDYLYDVSAAFGNCANSKRLAFSKTPVPDFRQAQSKLAFLGGNLLGMNLVFIESKFEETGLKVEKGQKCNWA
jgi:hypothetical protein